MNCCVLGVLLNGKRMGTVASNAVVHSGSVSFHGESSQLRIFLKIISSAAARGF
jgi:hypothetical protein